MSMVIPSGARAGSSESTSTDGAALVDLEIWAENQRGEITAPGQATVMLPSRDPRLPWFTDGRSLNLRDVALSEQMPPILPE